MDIQLEKRKGIQKKHIPYIIGSVFLLGLLFWIIWCDHVSTLKVNSKNLNIGNLTY